MFVRCEDLKEGDLYRFANQRVWRQLAKNISFDCRGVKVHLLINCNCKQIEYYEGQKCELKIVSENGNRKNKLQ